jgi:pyruvate dehydrogenase E2 component (dihydrolipoamide acetyltransferase)
VPTDAAGTVAGIHVKSGDTIAVGQPVLTLDSDGAETPSRVDESPEATADGVPADDEAAPRRATVEPEPATDGPDVHVAPRFADADIDAGGRPVAAAPSVRTFAREIGVDIRQVEGSGPAGRISMDDVKAHARRRPSAPEPDAPTSGSGSDAAAACSATGSSRASPSSVKRRLSLTLKPLSGPVSSAMSSPSGNPVTLLLIHSDGLSR